VANILPELSDERGLDALRQQLTQVATDIVKGSSVQGWYVREAYFDDDYAAPMSPDETRAADMMSMSIVSNAKVDGKFVVFRARRRDNNVVVTSVRYVDKEEDTRY
jgi:hypothetical protein